MTDEAMSPLRRRMIEDMTIRKFAPKTQQGYIRSVRNFAAFLGRSPDKASSRTCGAFSCILPRAAWRADRQSDRVGAAVLLQGDAQAARIVEHTTFIREPRKLPVVLSPEEVARLLEAAPGLKCGGAQRGLWRGLARRRGGLAKVGDIDSKRMMHPRRTGQGTQGPQCDAVAASARTAARLVEGGAARRAGCFPAANPVQADDDPPAEPGLPCRGPDSRDQEERLACTRCATASPPTCWSRTPISG